MDPQYKPPSCVTLTNVEWSGGRHPTLSGPIVCVCLWSSQPGFLNESSTLTILICSLFTSQHPLVSGFNRSHSNISSGLFLPLRKCRTSVSYSVFMVSPTYVDKAHPSGKSQKRGSFWPKNGKNIFFFFWNGLCMTLSEMRMACLSQCVFTVKTALSVGVFVSFSPLSSESIMGYAGPRNKVVFSMCTFHPSSTHIPTSTHKPPFHHPFAPLLRLACPPALKCHPGIPKELYDSKVIATPKCYFCPN